MDLRLKLNEGQHREEQLRERALRAEEKREDALRREQDLRDQNERLMEFHRAVTRSTAWRALQVLRGLVGRRW